MIETYAYARAGLVGNPSDGYYGKTISVIVGNFRARVLCYPSANLEIKPSAIDTPVYRSLSALRECINQNGYYGGVRLIMATIKRFADYCDQEGIGLSDRNFTLEYESNIPARVGLAGSSAIITATIRALREFFDVDIPRRLQPNLVLSAEVDELGIAAGLQDRVIQTYQGMVYMDFNRELMQEQGYGYYEELDHTKLPPLYVAYQADLSEGSEIVHTNLRERFSRGDPDVMNAMKRFAGITVEAKQALAEGDFKRLSELMNENFDLRASIVPLRQADLRLVHTGRQVGASSKFAGSGGAVVGAYDGTP
ncbi:MAG TPA: GHMP kinase, partial [bacterium]|nr:GHMP kinase [bacterium]